MRSMKTPINRVKPILMVTCVMFACQAIAGEKLATHERKIFSDIGDVDGVLKKFKGQHEKRSAMVVHRVNDNELRTEITNFHHRNGVVSISGKAPDSKNSTFVLKGTEKSLRGFMIKHDKNQAFEYATDDDGKMTITQVPISKIIPDLGDVWLNATTTITTGTVVQPVYSPMAMRQAKHIGPYNNEDVTKLESKPGSAWVFYLNHSAVMSGSTPLNNVTKENMYRAWQTVADAYSMYNMNITTNPAVYNAAKTANVARTGVINFVNQDGRSNAPLASFGTTSAGTLYRDPGAGFDYGYGIGLTAAHEVGHQMGMNHDHGGTGGEYFEGIAAFEWGPIMGNYWKGATWAHRMWTWSKGEYTTATNFEDDLKIMNVNEKVPFVADDNVSGKPMVIDRVGNIGPAQNFGQIEATGDTDAFTFSLAATGMMNLRIDPIEYLGMLDVNAKVVNAAGTVIAQSNLSVDRSAQFTNLSLPAGDYKVIISGGAEGTPQNGFSNYSSLGYYAMQGSIAGYTPPADVMLTSGVAKTGLSGAAGSWTYFAIDVPAGKSKVQFNTSGTTGDADLFARVGSKPTSTTYTCKSDGATSTETCSITTPAAGRYYIGILAYTAYSALSVTATISN